MLVRLFKKKYLHTTNKLSPLQKLSKFQKLLTQT